MNCIGGRPPSDLCGRVLVVIDQPLIGNRLDQLKVGEQVRVEHLGPISSIEALDKGVLIWLARLDIADRYALLRHHPFQLSPQTHMDTELPSLEHADGGAVIGGAVPELTRAFRMPEAEFRCDFLWDSRLVSRPRLLGAFRIRQIAALMLDWLSSEAEVLKRIVANRQALASTMYFALDSAFPYPEHAFAQSVYVGINIPRAKLQLSPDQRPGDVDCLIVPFSDNEILLERTIAIEAKIVRPSISNPGRNANTMGRAQVRGLLCYGFPFVGLVHISVPESMPSHMHWEVPEISDIVGSNGELIETGEYFIFDPFPLASARRQEGRVLALGLPVEVGYRVIALTLSNNGERFCGFTIGEARAGARNPVVSHRVLEAVRMLLTTEPHLFEVVHWFNEVGT
ncbi:Uncharacterised protein [Bordetella pertussis]|nr:Uncharacterised protein [Bordetella pertussis]CFO19386.1 Uncharacterised protein [Bordetella pertussis]CFO66732.1 Uncharacterised protein [Bordetella pertussis]CPK18115.1 Uncharacterised protein [Bordetella pertussis]CPP02642.1 Uncharacterised protein [Bordetella pertussis]